MSARKLRSLGKQSATIVKLLESAEATLMEVSNLCNNIRYHHGSKEMSLALYRVTRLSDKIKYEDDD